MSLWTVTVTSGKPSKVIQDGSCLEVSAAGDVSFTTAGGAPKSINVKTFSEAAGTFTMVCGTDDPTYGGQAALGAGKNTGSLASVDKAQLVDSFSAVRAIGTIVGWWRVRSENQVIADGSSLEIGDEHVTFVSVVEQRHVTLPVHLAEISMVFPRPQDHASYQGHARLKTLFWLTGAIHYKGTQGPRFDTFSAERIQRARAVAGALEQEGRCDLERAS